MRLERLRNKNGKYENLNCLERYVSEYSRCGDICSVFRTEFSQGCTIFSNLFTTIILIFKIDGLVPSSPVFIKDIKLDKWKVSIMIFCKKIHLW